MRIAGLLWLLCLAGCVEPRANLREAEPVSTTQFAGYRIRRDGEVWRVRAIAGGRRHRFQGSVEGTTGGIIAIAPDHPSLVDHVARAGNSVQFDFEAEQGEAGFDARTTGGCLRFDLYVDGKRRPERVRFENRNETPEHLPSVSCP